MKMKQLSCALLLCLGLTGCQAVTDTLSTVNSALGSVNSALSGTMISANDQNSADNSVQNAKPNSGAKALYNEAKPAISKYVAAVACNNENLLKIYADPDSTAPSEIILPQIRMHHHKSGCLNISRIEKIEKKAANAILFQVVYVSPQSEEVDRVRHSAIKQPNGEWLFNYFGY